MPEEKAGLRSLAVNYRDAAQAIERERLFRVPDASQRDFLGSKSALKRCIS
ncbi:hypothetical protein QA640_25080 [Bradyrhizobium sp. CB82]|uniref:hypothetical protein n=1 Tax=Bradyrhizobium sp. CB82 TaxID=3039159 RepID=UPI0024B11766|nr:hypothetical protein [Bradyrhizobium sp. CB82]WFU37737.1 hypothetical protein QA640_25080 [Bradyrhizobium sp. CB82]